MFLGFIPNITYMCYLYINNFFFYFFIISPQIAHISVFVSIIASIIECYVAILLPNNTKYINLFSKNDSKPSIKICKYINRDVRLYYEIQRFIRVINQKYLFQTEYIGFKIPNITIITSCQT